MSVNVHAHSHTNSPELRDKALWGVVAEFDSPEKIIVAGREVHHTHGYKKIDALLPFPVHGIDDAIGVPRSLLGYIVILGAAFGLINAVLIVWWASVVDYPLVVGGKPLFAWEFAMPPMFELTVLFSAFTALGGMLWLNGLPRFYHPTFQYSKFRRATDDRFLLTIEASDPKFDIEQTPAILRALGAVNVEVVEQ